MPPRRLGEILCEKKLLNPGPLREALEEQRRLQDQGTRIRLGVLLVERKAVTVQQVRMALFLQGKTVLYCAQCKKSYNVRNYAPPAPARCGRCRKVLLIPEETTLDAAETTILPLVPPSSPEGRNRAGEPFGRYRLLEELGKDALEAVYKAWDPQSMRNVALRRFTASDDQLRDRFLKGARAAVPLKHEHIASIYEVGTEGQEAYATMTLVEGETFEAYLAPRSRAKVSGAKDGLSKLREEVGILVQVVEALAAAHAQGVVHGNLKPTNVLLDKDKGAFVADFGFSKSGEVSPYFAPEQVAGQPATTASDIWAVGVMLYEVATGRKPFEDASEESLKKAIREQPARPLAQLRKDVPLGLETLCLRCLHKDPKQRVASTKQLAVDLRSYQTGRPISVNLPPLPKPIPKPPVTPRPTTPPPVVEEPVRKEEPLPPKHRLLPWAIAAVILLGMGIAAAVVIPSKLRRGRFHKATEEAQKAESQRRFADAKAAWLRVLAEEPGNLVALAGVARAEVEDLLADAEALWRAATLEGSREKREAALALCGQAIEKSSGHGRAYEVRGAILFATHDFAGAEEDLRKAIGLLDPERGRVARGLLGRMYLERSLDLQDSDRYYRTPRTKPSAEWTDLARKELSDDDGWAAWARGDREAAAAWFRKREGEAEACWALSWLMAGAERDLWRERALERNALYSRAILDRGNARRALEDWDGAFQDYTEAIRIDSKYAAAYNNRGLVKERQGEHAAAMVDFGEAIRLDPKFAAAFNNRGLVREETNDLQGALADYNETLRQAPQDPAAYANRGRVLRAQGNKPEAIRDFEKALGLAGADWPPRAAVEEWLRETKGP